MSLAPTIERAHFAAGTATARILLAFRVVREPLWKSYPALAGIQCNDSGSGRLTLTTVGRVSMQLDAIPIGLEQQHSTHAESRRQCQPVPRIEEHWPEAATLHTWEEQCKHDTTESERHRKPSARTREGANSDAHRDQAVCTGKSRRSKRRQQSIAGHPAKQLGNSREHQAGTDEDTEKERHDLRPQIYDQTLHLTPRF